MYELFADLCEKRGVTPYRIAKDCGFSNVTLSDWKNKGQTPKADKLVKIARYLGTTVEYLMTGEEPEPPASNSSTPLRQDEKVVLSCYNKLNSSGKKEAIKRLDELAQITQYSETEKKSVPGGHIDSSNLHRSPELTGTPDQSKQTVVL